MDSVEWHAGDDLERRSRGTGAGPGGCTLTTTFNAADLVSAAARTPHGPTGTTD